MPPQCDTVVLLSGERSFLQPTTPSPIPTSVSTTDNRAMQQMMMPNAYLSKRGRKGGREGGEGVHTRWRKGGRNTEMAYYVLMYMYIPVHIIFLNSVKDLVEVALSNESHIHFSIQRISTEYVWAIFKTLVVSNHLYINDVYITCY